MEYTSESTYEVNQKVPVNKTYYVYNIEYKCKICMKYFAIINLKVQNHCILKSKSIICNSLTLLI